MEGHLPDISFSGLTYTISQSNKEEKVLLNNVSGQVASSRLTAILGPSGAGKTTLLKLLACSVTGGRQQGDIWVQDELVNPAAFRQHLSVVWQSDILLPTATVKEAIMTSALLRLPQALPYPQKAERVEQILTELDLHGVRDSLIGVDLDGAMSGISGGERRRVSVGIELVTEASTLFLDEPTTGLDSEAAESLIGLLAGLARRKGRTVICTIHQPSSDICALFDDLILMAEARILYCGPWLRVDDYISNAGMSRPSHRSTAEHLLRLCKHGEKAVPILADMHERSWRLIAAAAEKVSDDGGRRGVPALRGVASLPKPDIEAPPPPCAPQGPPAMLEIAASTVSGALSDDVIISVSPTTSSSSSFRSSTSGGAAAVFARGARPPSIPFQVAILTARFALSWARRPASVAMQAAQFLIAALLIGAMYHRLPGSAADGEYNRVASLWFCAMVALFQSGNNALTIAYGQKALLRREAQAGHYKCGAYCLAKWATMLPLQLVYLALYTCVVYFLVGYQPLLDKFCVFSGVILLLMLISESLGMLCAGLFRTELIGSIVLQGLYVPLLMFVGFFQTQTPACFAWIKALSFATYAYAALVKNEFSGLALSADDGAVMIPDAVSIIPPNIESALSISADLGILLGVLVGMRVIVYAQLRISIALKLL